MNDMIRLVTSDEMSMPYVNQHSFKKLELAITYVDGVRFGLQDEHSELADEVENVSNALDIAISDPSPDLAIDLLLHVVGARSAETTSEMAHNFIDNVLDLITKN